MNIVEIDKDIKRLARAICSVLSYPFFRANEAQRLPCGEPIINGTARRSLAQIEYVAWRIYTTQNAIEAGRIKSRNCIGVQVGEEAIVKGHAGEGHANGERGRAEP